MSRPSSRSSRPRSPSPTDFKNLRSIDVIGGEFTSLTDDVSTFTPPRNNHSSASTRDLDGPGHRSNERILRRAARTGSPSSDSRPHSSQDHGFSAEIFNPSVPERIPNARLGAEVPIANHTNILGSSQLTSGCQGDFCNFNLLSWEPGQSSLPRRTHSAGGDYKKALHNAGLLESATEESIQGKELLMWNYRSVLAARQQAPLVKMFLERHIRGEHAKLSIPDDYMDMAVAGKLPARYYQEVPVCSQCYQIYNILDAARAKSVKPASSIQQEQNDLYALESGGSVVSGDSILQGSLTNFQTQQLSSLNRRRPPDAINSPARPGKQQESVDASLLAAYEAIKGLTKMDVAEIRTMQSPPPAVQVVMEAVVLLLTGKYLTFKESYPLLSGGETFLKMLKEFDVADVTPQRLQALAGYVDNPLFRPEHVLPSSRCASKFCAWVHGIVHAARHQRGLIHERTDTMRPAQPAALKPLRKSGAVSGRDSQATKSRVGSAEEELSFVQKLKKMKASRSVSPNRGVSRESAPLDRKLPSSKKPLPSVGEKPFANEQEESMVLSKSLDKGSALRTGSKFDPGPTPSFADLSVTLNPTATASKKISKREAKALKAMQSKSIDRLAAQTAIEGSVGVVGLSKTFRCADGITRMPYVVMGKFSITVEKCNFVVIHDFFDTYDGTAILFKQLVTRHNEGCQVICFNYPGQAHTTWPRLSQAEKERGAKEPLLSNEWIADRVHELLRHAEEAGDILLSRPFHLVGMGLGASIAASFCQRYAYHDMYVNSLRSVVSINGFLYPDAQLSSILHAAYQVFESTPHTRPDIAVSYWSRFVFSEEYLSKVNPNLALNIYTAVNNPITNDGRVKLVRGCLTSKDLRGSLLPDAASRSTGPKEWSRFQPIQVPVIVLQSTEDGLVHAANVDSFLVGRTAKHLWSHMLNVPTEEQMARTFDVSAQWVGRMSSSAEDYAGFSSLGRAGLKMILDSLRNPRGAFVMWARTGHVVQQEYKAAFLDLMDALTCPSEEYFGLNIEPADGPNIFAGSVVDPDLTFPPVKEDPSLILKLTIDSQLSACPHTPDEEAVEFDQQQTMEEDLNEAIDSILKSVKLPTTAALTYPTQPVEPDETSELHSVEALPEPVLEATAVPAPPAVAVTAAVAALPAAAALPAPTQVPMPGPEPDQQGVHPPPEELAEYWQAAEVKSFVDNERLPVVLDAPAVPLILSQDSMLTSNTVQRSKQQWISTVPNVTTALALEAELRAKQQEYLALEEKLRKLRTEGSMSQLEGVENYQLEQREDTEAQDLQTLDHLAQELDFRQKEREFAEMQRRLKIREVEDMLVKDGLVPAYSDENLLAKAAFVEPVRPLPPIHYTQPADLPKAIVEGKDVISKLDQMLADEEEARKRGVLSVHEFEKIKMQMAERQLERDQKLRTLSTEELDSLHNACSIQMGRIVRGFIARRKVKRLEALRALERKQRRCIVKMQSLSRGFLGRRRFKRFKALYLTKLRGEHSAIDMQRVFRGYAARNYFRKLRRWRAVSLVQRAFRGYLGRNAFKREKRRLELLRKKFLAATKIQSMWRMKVSKEEYRSLRIHILAAIEIQRFFRGYLGRKIMARRRLWENSKPGPERIKLGLQFIEESKQAFDRQQEEIDALHRAQERAEARVSHIHAELKDSEKELVVLERELQEIDQIERDLQVLSHERNLLSAGIEDAAGMPRLAGKGHKDLVSGRESVHETDPMAERKRRAEAYALEMTIQLKRAEREKKRQELEIEFAAVFQEVEKKRKALQRLELSLADMEATRERKDREFRRLQKNLMQLLLEQKQELDDLREKGLELETATATTAAAAVATAQKAKEHEKRSTAMFSQTEELMKFQFMSMSLSYFSSLNMLKSLRDMNSDTTSAAIALSADASATAAGAAAAANLPSVKKLHLGGNDFVEASIRKKKEELLAAEKAEKEFKVLVASPLPANVRTWSVHDVSRWLDSLSLSQYKDAFLEGSVDGPFLLELREEDLVQVLNIKHRLHVRKLMVSREKLKPLSQQELQYKDAVEREDRAEGVRDDMGVPSLDTVFSQARNGRIKRVEESLNLGFPIDSEDEKGNTLLLVSSQNSNKRLAEMLLLRGASINHQNAQGNTALHYALAFDPEGAMAEYLIEHGADDTLENIEGLTPYDGVAK